MEYLSEYKLEHKARKDLHNVNRLSVNTYYCFSITTTPSPLCKRTGSALFQLPIKVMQDDKDIFTYGLKDNRATYNFVSQ